ncbi:hypothetical protein Fmac_006193 [Flemingia macrophylla]|uniref:Uncharacterized protein n=1 Tax=Flemingia macrophylla TaxID=520843 RepID=A0ABD1N9X1_9FABA
MDVITTTMGDDMVLVESDVGVNLEDTVVMNQKTWERWWFYELSWWHLRMGVCVHRETWALINEETKVLVHDLCFSIRMVKDHGGQFVSEFGVDSAASNCSDQMEDDSLDLEEVENYSSEGWKLVRLC